MELAIVRAAHLHVFLDQLREIGVPVEREIVKSGLSPWILEQPDAYVSISRSLECLANCCRDIELMDLGFLATQRESLTTLSREVQRAVNDAPSGLARLSALHKFSAHEDNVLSIRLQHEGAQIRVISELADYFYNPYICFSEWVDLQALLSIIRSAVGQSWSPIEMTFVSRHRPSALVQEAFPNTRILTGQPHTSILMRSSLLVAPCLKSGRSNLLPTLTTQSEIGPPRDNWSFSTALRAAVRPYLYDGYPALTKIAEIFGMSGRTLQRRLRDCGRSYSEVLQEARFEMAQELLVDPSARIIDVALAVGYENPQHFARAFRRHAGVSPTIFRKSLAEAS
ncbi:MAG: helix-turn-helix domain-containing protein [Sedimentitalea sp.]|uniref:AraC family transcriptional regulator n=1 Tax=Sedimentitalea sp. TaxID=2048915 RepID=UPI0032657B6F